MSETFGQALRRFRLAAGLSQTELAAVAHLGQSDISRYERDRQHPAESTAGVLAEITGGGRRLLSTWAEGEPNSVSTGEDAKLAALELARRVEASDVGAATLQELEQGFENLATAYPASTPDELSPRLRTQLTYVQQLISAGRLSLSAHRRLVELAGWLCLLTATVHIDRVEHDAASAYLRTAESLAGHAEHVEIRAWCAETEAWRQLTSGDAQAALTLAQRAQQLAPRGSSAGIQATAQVGRARARLGDAAGTYRALETVHALADGLERRHEPEHHYQYDTGKLGAYTATTLAWIGDPAAVEQAAATAERFRPSSGAAWPRRYASAHVDLALGASKLGEHQQAADALRTALDSGVLVPSNYWRAGEVVTALSQARVPAAEELQDSYRRLLTS